MSTETIRPIRDGDMVCVWGGGGGSIEGAGDYISIAILSPPD